MKVHVIIDFMHIYYKYFYQLKDHRIKRLSAPIDWNGSVIEKDTTLIYYPLRDIENIRKDLNSLGHDVTMSICFDMKSHRNDEGVAGGDSYKSGRKNVFTEEDFENIAFIEKLLKEAGHNTYRFDGYEADDIVNQLVREYSKDFEYTVIYTNDKDLLVNISDNVGVMRFKAGHGYSQVDKNNYETYLESEFKVFIPYNAIGLFLSTAGDSADKIKGISKFGPKAFSKLITKVSAKNNIDWSKCGDYNELAKVVEMCAEFLTDEQFNQMKESFVLVSNLEILDDIPAPVNQSTLEKRNSAYMPYKMISLCP